MARCPNCGSSVRTGAKFCTTCGFRLPIEAPVEQHSESARSPFDITGSSAGSQWPSPPTETQPEPAEEPEPVVAVDEPAHENAVSDELESDVAAGSADTPEGDTDESQPASAPFTGWPAFGAARESDSAWERDLEADDSAAAVPVENETQGGVEEAIASWSTESQAEAEPDAEESTDEVSDSTENPYAWLDRVEAESEIEPDEAGSDDPATDTASDSFAPDDVPPAEQQEPIELDEAQPTPAGALAAQGTESAPIARAAQLLDELQRLLPSLAAAGTPSDDSSLDVAAELERVTSEHALDPDQFASLRAAVATAQARPRDVDIMLDLVGRAGAIGDVIAAYEQYQSAISSAIRALRGDVDSEPAPRW